MDGGLLLGGDLEEAGLEGSCWVLLCPFQPGWGQAPRGASSGQVGSGPRAGEACVSTLLAVRPPPLTLLSRRLDTVLPAPPPAAVLRLRGGLPTEPTPWTLPGMLGIQLVLSTRLMKESPATETQWTQQASGQPSGQWGLAWCPLCHSPGLTKS